MRRQVLLPAVLGLLAACASEDGGAAPDPVPSEFSVPAAEAEAYPTAYLSSVRPHGTDERVVIANNADIRVDMGGWYIDDRSGDRLDLGIGRQIDVGATLDISGSCGDSTDQVVYACADAPDVFADSGDVLILRDAAGTEVARLAYGDAAE